jgi:hypothetical protein
MPGIDYAALRARISILDVLELLHFQPVGRSRYRVRGRCPLYCSPDPRAFVAYLDTDRYYCHRCLSSGNQLELWRDTQDLPLFHASRDLCRRLNIPVPEIHRW